MSEGGSGYRPGQGKISSSTEAKDSLGRTSFRRITKGGSHIGTGSNTTEYLASRRLEKGKPKPPTAREMGLVFEDNPSDVKVLRASGMSDAEIYETLKNR